MSHRRYAVVGAGHRAQMYIDAITTVYADRAVLAAICEPNPGRAQVYVDEVVGRGIPAPSTRTPDRLAEMISAEHIHQVIITARAHPQARKNLLSGNSVHKHVYTV